MRVVISAFGCYLAIAVVVTFPLILSFGTSVSDPVDAVLNTWIVAHGHHALLTQPRELFNTNIFYPYPGTLLFSETLLLPMLWLMPVFAATGNALLTHNVLVLMGFTLTGTSGFLLGRWLFHNVWAALVVGMIFAFNSYTLSNIGQAQLLHLEWLPLALIYAVKVVRKPSWRAGALMALFLAAQFYTVIYYGIFGFLVIGMVGAGVWLGHGYPSFKARLQGAGALALGLTAGVAACAPLAWRYFALSSTFGFERTLAETWPYAASVESWISANPGNLLYGAWLGKEMPVLGFYALDTLFPGVLLLGLAVVGAALGLWQRLARRSDATSRGRGAVSWWPLWLLLGIIIFGLLSFGPYFQVKSLQPDFEITLPYAWVHAWVPGFQALRAPIRFAAVVFLGIAIFAGYSLLFVRWRMARIGLFALLLVEVLTVPTTAMHTPHTSADQQAAYAWLASLPPTAYVEVPIYPFGEEGSEARWLESQVQSIRHWQKTPVGYSGFFPPRHAELLAFLNEFPRAEVVDLLQAMGVEWVVVHRDRLTDEAKLATDAAIRTHNWEVQKWGDVWAIHLPPSPAPLPVAHIFLPAVAQAGGTVTIGQTLHSDGAVPLIPGSDLGRVRVEWRQDGKVILDVHKIVQPPFTVDGVAVANFPMPVPEQPGTYELLFWQGESPQAAATGMVEVVADSAPPEVTLLPVQPEPVDATLQCTTEGDMVEVLMQTVGWYDAPFTLSARLLDEQGGEVARSRDVEFAPDAARRSLLRVQPYTLPFDALPFERNSGATARPLSIELVAYQWQQSAERVVGRDFVDGEGNAHPAITLPLTLAASCLS